MQILSITLDALPESFFFKDLGEIIILDVQYYRDRFELGFSTTIELNDVGLLLDEVTDDNGNSYELDGVEMDATVGRWHLRPALAGAKSLTLRVSMGDEMTPLFRHDL